MKRIISGIMLALLLVTMAAGAAGTAVAQDPPEIEPPATPVPATEAPEIEESTAQEPGSLVNGVAVCAEGLSGEQIDPAACIEPAADLEFYAANPNTDNVAFGSTGGDGLVSFPLDQFAIGGDQGAVVEVGLILESSPYGAVIGTLVSCTVNGEPVDAGLMDSGVQPGGASLAVQLTVAPGDQVACEWFLSHGEPGDQDDDTGDSGDTDAPPVTQLPSTGTGAAEGNGPAGVWLAGAVLVAALVVGALARTGMRLLAIVVR